MKKNLKLFNSFSFVILATICFGILNVKASILPQHIPYYGEDFYRDLDSGISNDQLVEKLKKILRSTHQSFSVSFDQFSDNCQNQGPGTKCYKHISLGYDKARTFMMGTYYLISTSDHGYGLPDMYCGDVKYQSDFKADPPAPHQIPDGTILNTEHTWPQSKFTSKHDKEMQKSDLHHLYPVDSQMNSIRGNNHFGEVVKDTKILKCPASRIGTSSTSKKGEVFEPPTAHKGNVARALFYFSINYDMSIEPSEEAILRKWNKEDPVDEEEIRRNNEIMNIQGNRNPFIDFPDLPDRINDFK